MKFLIISPGKNHDPLLKDSIEDFSGRVSRYYPLEWRLFPADTLIKEGEKILASIESSDVVVLLDEKGKSVSSKGLADFLEKKLNESVKRIVFIIGGAYGVPEEVRVRAQVTFSLSALVFPHQIVRLIVSEQLYRACTILRGEKYHHE